MNTQKGFTLIELMISLVLALLITAAVVQVYFISVKTSTMQQAASGIVDNNVFGLQQVERNLRMAGLGLSDVSSSNAKQSGILIHAQGPLDNRFGFTPTSADVLTTHGTKPSNIQGMQSDQLTIQYRAPMMMRDCEGRLALGPREVINDESRDNSFVQTDGQVIVERYFVHNNDGNLELRCDAGRYLLEAVRTEHKDTTDKINSNEQYALLTQPNVISDLGDNGVLVASGVDLFKVQLAVADGNSTRYMSIDEYQKSNTLSNNAIIGVKLGMVTSGNTPVLKTETATNPTYILFGKEIVPKSGPSDYIYRVYESSVMLRNSRNRK